ncbi:hypothetical protein BH23GEM6_BH23GEM6_12280 [soil metagenome]
MSSKKNLPGAGERLIQSLASLSGVHQAFADKDTDRIYLVCNSSEPAAAILTAADDVARKAEVRSPIFQIVYSAPPVPARRARFLSVSIEPVRTGITAASVQMEWGGEIFTGRSEGESIPAGEMRSCAQATLKALHAVLEGAAIFNLIGLKATRIFDTDLVAVLLRSEQAADDQQLIGAAMVVGDPHHAVVRAVLNATNRMLGNFLFVSN